MHISFQYLQLRTSTHNEQFGIVIFAVASIFAPFTRYFSGGYRQSLAHGGCTGFRRRRGDSRRASARWSRSRGHSKDGRHDGLELSRVRIWTRLERQKRGRKQGQIKPRRR